MNSPATATKSLLAQMVLRWRCRRQRRSMLSLLQLDDRTLTDIGLTRGDIIAAANSSAPLPRAWQQRIDEPKRERRATSAPTIATSTARGVCPP